MVKQLIIKSNQFNPENYSEIIRDGFTQITRMGVDYMTVFTFDKYCEGVPFDFLFDNTEEYERWIYEGELKYFIIPLDLVPQIAHYADWVKEAYPDKIFDVVLDKKEVIVEGQPVTIPTNILKMIPCGIAHFNAEGEMLLDAVIESWNTQVPSKRIDFGVKFYNLHELETFIDNAKQI
jgi:hypothetical protein